MQYMGGKARQAKHIVPVIMELAAGNSSYLEPFVGGASIASRVAGLFESVTIADAMPDVVEMWRAATSGWVPPVIDREEYYRLKTAQPSAERAYAGFSRSFGGKWFGGYIAPDYARASHAGQVRAIARKAEGLLKAGALRIECAEYLEHNRAAGALIYCDPPYAGTTPYGGLPPFDSEKFWRTMQQWAASGAVVLVSEYTAPEGIADIVHEVQAVKSLSANANAAPSVERLYRVRG